ncbi:hypothetical protein HID58_063336 [Brassica napus]|uniref:Uncharacterized protein n=2 Tax=Brassica napus TaxID=3708 RepID=A0ABQ8A3Z2_BRANA|nr:late embryogenesis abundant protein M17-like [Brassica napus]KAH0887240.1 hypothetical protein HID58_063336 [Brassica napus]
MTNQNMGNLKSLALLALLFSFSLAVFADTSKDAATHAKEEVKPSEATDAIAPQQRGCRYGCCGAYAYGQCAACCSRPQAAEAETEANDVVVEPEQRGRGGCRYGCCGSYAFGRCSACCSKAQAEEAMKTEAVEENAVEPQQRGGGCRYGCCGSWRYGRCSYCCRGPQAEAEVVEPQQIRRCRYGCCGRYPYARCSVCCTKKMATEEETKTEEAKP